MKLNVKDVQKRIVEIAYETGCGHVASALSCSELLVKTYNQAENDIIILSKGHGALAQYVILNMLGKLSDEKLKSYYRGGGISGHTTLDKDSGIYASTGSLGHGLAIGIGYAIANPDKRVFVILGDGECEEGSTLESLALIKRLKLQNIIPVIDVNGWQGFKETEEENLPPKNEAYRYYSIKGGGMGKKLEDLLEAHYAKIDAKIYKKLVKFIEKQNDKG